VLGLQACTWPQNGPFLLDNSDPDCSQVGYPKTCGGGSSHLDHMGTCLSRVFTVSWNHGKPKGLFPGVP
jgi:hypothetical protein